MKTQTVNTLKRNALSITLLAATLMLSFQSIAAINYVTGTKAILTNEVKTGDKKNAKNMQVISLGNVSEGTMLEVNYANSEAGEFLFFITNAEEEVLFENNYNGKNFAKKVLIPSNLEGQKIFLNIKDFKTGTTFSTEVEVITKSTNQVNIVIK